MVHRNGWRDSATAKGGVTTPLQNQSLRKHYFDGLLIVAVIGSTEIEVSKDERDRHRLPDG
jgi:hypothetical protein